MQKKMVKNFLDHLSVGMRRFELPTTRPPDAYSNLAELHPGASVKAMQR